jgi:valyl-tRNA synthetase
MELEKAYDAASVEEKIYKLWEDSGYFNPDNLGGTEVFSMMLPPPNVTGTLHLGHAYEDTMQDIIARYQRMLGKKVLWLPGTDHAPIATESKVAKMIEKDEEKRKADLGRDEFVRRVKEFAQNSHDTIVSQVRRMGASVDWSREAYTFDEPRNLAVRTAFKRMYDLGLIYRGNRVINWDVKGQTTISNDEIVYLERPAKLYTFRYSKDFPIAISTTRPETKVGDTAVAVNPNDERYAPYIGKEYDLEFCGVPIHIKIIADNSVEKEFGTGALGVTPAHSMIDAEIAQRHNLPMKQVIDERGRITVGNENIKDKKIAEAREVIVQWLKEENLLEKEEDITQNVATAERTGGVIEPLPKLQWFVNVTKEFPIPHSTIQGIQSGDTVTLKKVMHHVVETGQIEIAPQQFEKIYSHWINNLRDWCISRQLWFGHRIPVWYRPMGDHPQGGKSEINSTASDSYEIYCGVEAPEGEGWQQDPDTLDTWFSSGLWTFSTLGWPSETKDLKTYHPTSLIMPGYEILPLWVARMILMSTFLIGEIPFRKVLLHGIVRDSQGRKFSKSLNNGIDPLEMSDKYGTDALRMALIFSAALGNDTVFDEQKVKGMKHFANKLWNIARFVMQNVTAEEIGFKDTDTFDLEEGKMVSELGLVRKIPALVALSPQYQEGELLKNMTNGLENFRLHEAAQAVYESLWHKFADIYIEYSKDKLLHGNEDEKRITKTILFKSLRAYLKLLHPFMPFITEHIWQLLKEQKLVTTNQLMVAEWPK